MDINSMFMAPKGCVRVVREDMDDGEVRILADFYFENLAFNFVKELRKDETFFIYTMWNNNGKEVCDN